MNEVSVRVLWLNAYLYDRRMVSADAFVTNPTIFSGSHYTFPEQLKFFLHQ